MWEDGKRAGIETVPERPRSVSYQTATVKEEILPDDADDESIPSDHWSLLLELKTDPTRLHGAANQLPWLGHHWGPLASFSPFTYTHGKHYSPFSPAMAQIWSCNGRSKHYFWDHPERAIEWQDLDLHRDLPTHVGIRSWPLESGRAASWCSIYSQSDRSLLCVELSVSESSKDDDGVVNN